MMQRTLVLAVCLSAVAMAAHSHDDHEHEEIDLPFKVKVQKVLPPSSVARVAHFVKDTRKSHDEADGSLLGVAAFSIDESNPTGAELELMFVEPCAMGGGLGRALMQDALTRPRVRAWTRGGEVNPARRASLVAADVWVFGLFIFRGSSRFRRVEQQ